MGQLPGRAGCRVQLRGAAPGTAEKTGWPPGLALGRYGQRRCMLAAIGQPETIGQVTGIVT